jgi:DNA invertase Pin-like site-specific DNA recombinase
LSGAAIYLPRQTTADQAAEIRQLALAHGYEPFDYEEVEWAGRRRPVFKWVVANVQAGAVQVVCVRSLDSLGRGLSGLRTFLNLTRQGVQVLSLEEPWTATEGPGRKPLIEALAWVVGAERQRHVAKTKAGLVRARRHGKHIGRPRIPPHKLQAAAADVAAGMSQRGAARNRGISDAALRAYLKQQARQHFAAGSTADTDLGQQKQVVPASVETGAVA